MQARAKKRNDDGRSVERDQDDETRKSMRRKQRKKERGGDRVSAG